MENYIQQKYFYYERLDTQMVESLLQEYVAREWLL